MTELDEIKEMLSNHENRISKLENKKGVKKTARSQPPMDDVIESLNDLIDNSYFDRPRRYKDIIKQLKTNATFSKNGKYKTALSELVKNKRLKRKQVEHQWEYSKNDR